jgi:hypothetical protein
MALAVKHLIYRNSQVTSSHFIVTHRTHPLNNKTQNNTFIKQSPTLHTAYDAFFIFLLLLNDIGA